MNPSAASYLLIYGRPAVYSFYHNSGFDPDSPSELLNIEPIKAVHAPYERIFLKKPKSKRIKSQTSSLFPKSLQKKKLIDNYEEI